MTKVPVPPTPTSHKRGAFSCGIIAAAIGFISFTVLAISSIRQSTSSTAAIGYLFIPITSLIGAVPFFIFGYSVKYLKNWYFSNARKFDYKVALAFAASIFLFLASAKITLEGIYLTGLVREIKSMNEAELEKTIEKPFFGKNKFVLGAIAQNKCASGELLQRIGSIDKKELHERMGSVFDVMGENRRGLAVMRLVAQHPNVLPTTLEQLSNSSDDYVLLNVAANKKTSVATLRRLSQRKTDLIDWGLAGNPLTPSDVLSKLSSSANEYTRAGVAQNPSTPLKDLEKLAVDKVWNVRRGVAENAKVSLELLGKLCEDHDEQVRRIAEYHYKPRRLCVPITSPNAQLNVANYPFKVQCEENGIAKAILSLKRFRHNDVLRTWQVQTPAVIALNVADLKPDDYLLFIAAPGYASQWVTIKVKSDSIIFGAETMTLFRKRYVVMRYAITTGASRNFSSEKNKQRVIAVPHWGQIPELRGDWQIWQKDATPCFEFHRCAPKPSFGFVKAAKGQRFEDILNAPEDQYMTRSIKAEPGMILLARTHGNSAKDQCYAKIEIQQITENPPDGVEIAAGRD
jgi:hypothetical protein